MTDISTQPQQNLQEAIQDSVLPIVQEPVLAACGLLMASNGNYQFIEGDKISSLALGPSTGMNRLSKYLPANVPGDPESRSPTKQF